MPQHTHSWRRLKGNKFQCIHPTCYSKMVLEHLEGKLAECAECKKQFIIFLPNVKSSDGRLTCPDCLTGEYHLTLEGRNKLIEEMVVQDIQKAHDQRFKSLEEFQDRLTRQELGLRDKESKLTRKQNELDKLEFEMKEQFNDKLEWYREQCRLLKVKEQRIALKLRQRKTKLLEDRLKFKEEKKKLEPPKVETITKENVEFTNEQIGNSLILHLEKVIKGETDEG